MKHLKIFMIIFVLYFVNNNMLLAQYYGNGRDGTQTITSTIYTDNTRGQVTNISDNTPPTLKTIDLNMVAGGDFTFPSGAKKLVIIIQMEGGIVGKYEISKITNNSTNSHLVLETTNSLAAFSFTSGDKVQVILIPQYNDFKIDGGLVTCNEYDVSNGTGGILMFCVKGILTITNDGKIEATGKGYPNGLYGATYYGTGGYGGAGALQSGNYGDAGYRPTHPDGFYATSNGSHFLGLSNYSIILSTKTYIVGGSGGYGSQKIVPTANPGTGNNTTAFPLEDYSYPKLIMGNCGNGGNGGIGGEAGGNGGGGGIGSINSTPQPGELGNDGAQGGLGGDGGRGGGAIYVRSYEISTDGTYLCILDDGGPGTSGSTGIQGYPYSHGGDGGSGGVGECVGNVIYGQGGGAGGGQGGDGSGGGNGGNGGDGGAIWIEYDASATLTNSEVSLDGGNGGIGGYGGEPSGHGDFGIRPDFDVTCDLTAQYSPITETWWHRCDNTNVYKYLTTAVRGAANGNGYDFFNNSGGVVCTYRQVNTIHSEIQCFESHTISGNNLKPNYIINDIYQTYVTDYDVSSGADHVDCDQHFNNLSGIIDGGGIGNETLTTMDFPRTGTIIEKYDIGLEILKKVSGSVLSGCICDCTVEPDPKKGPNGTSGNKGTDKKQNHFHMNNLHFIVNSIPDKTNVQFELLPNPAKESISLIFNDTQKHQLKINVIDNKASVILTIDYNSKPGKNNLNININTLKSGNYLLKVQSIDFTKILKFDVL